MRKQKISFRAPADIVEKVQELKKRKSLADMTAAYNFVIEDYFRRIDQASEDPNLNSEALETVKAEIQAVRKTNDDLTKMLLVIGSQDEAAKIELAKRWPQYFTKT